MLFISLPTAAVLAVVGISVEVLTSGVTGDLIGAGFLGVAGVIAISWVFLRVGLSEDEDRAARDGARQEREHDPGSGQRGSGHTAAASHSGPRSPRRPPRRRRRP